MDVKKHDEIMSYIMNKLEDEKVNVSDGISIWHSMGLVIFSQLDGEKQNDKDKIYESIKEYLDEMQKLKI
jgi:acid stress-induced BolA-like protein IbaG/YrbA